MPKGIYSRSLTIKHKLEDIERCVTDRAVDMRCEDCQEALEGCNDNPATCERHETLLYESIGGGNGGGVSGRSMGKVAAKPGSAHR
ncbi:hypothetical protein CCP3SC15_380009 [Gammaproteobacteria bacterium]